jgi:predicted ATP-grasp superfamily ATP-dependent carboligase
LAILIAALSGRALAAAARRAGDEVIVSDLFGDLDTRALARWTPLPGDLARGIDRDAVVEMLRRLPASIEGIVYGSGFDSKPTLIGDMALARPLLGNRAEVVEMVKDETRFAALLGAIGLPHPRIASRPGSGGGWLRKKRGGAGGAHVQWASDGAADGCYFQKFARGRPVSALFVADGREARIFGFSEQWAAPTDATPFRYGGCAGPVSVAPGFRAAVEAGCNAVVAATGLLGLNSLDMLLDGDGFTVLELNPRPGATLEIFDVPPWPPLWKCHLAGVAGRLPAHALPSASPARAAAIVYAPRALHVPAGFVWPEWCADIPAPRTKIAAGGPVCTVRAEGATVAAARASVEGRVGSILRALGQVSAPLTETA